MIAIGSFFIQFSSEMPWALSVQTNGGWTDAPVYFISNLVNMLTTMCSLHLITARKGSCGKVMFLHLSYSVHGEGGLCPGGWGGGSLSRGGSLSGGSVREIPPDMVMSGRYASYWNAFLLRAYLHVTSPVPLKSPSKVNFV